MIDPRIPLAWFANHGGEPVTAASAGGSWIAYHSDRSKTPEENAAIMLAAQIRFNKPVWNDEPIGADALAQPGKRVNDPDWFRRQAEADRVLGGSTYHFSAGLWAEVRLLDDVQREAGRLWAGVSGPSVEGPVTPEEIAQVVAGLFFEDISKLLKLAGVGTPGTEPARRPAVHAWATARIEFLVGSYKRVFKRALDLEGAGSWILWAIKGKTDEWIEAEQVKAYARGER